MIVDILLQNFLGIMPSKPVDISAMDFLARNRSAFEPWLINLAYTLQRENISQRERLHKDEFYNGSLFVIRLLYSLTNKDLPVLFPKQVNPEQNKNPQGDVDSFLTGMKDQKNGKKDVQVSESQAGKV